MREEWRATEQARSVGEFDIKVRINNGYLGLSVVQEKWDWSITRFAVILASGTKDSMEEAKKEADKILKTVRGDK